ncbi:MAG TPA: deoxyribonuclease IV [Nocardioidaceae bacterium]|nr:deoxyribonuclease IV [Nocardioidaceae bacterium]
MSLRNPIGTHLKVGKGLHAGAFADAVRIGAETIQVFTGNPRGWATSDGDPVQDRLFRDACGEAGIPTFLHTPYLVNLGSPTPTTYANSVRLVAHNLKRAAEIGAEGVVVHTGSCVAEGSYDDAMRQVREGLLPVLEAIEDEDAPWLLLEPTAGQGRSLCARIDDLEPYLAALDHHPKAGICLDTCHAFAAGEPLDEPGGTTRVVDRILELGSLRLVHANDSMDVRGSFRDRHEKIGEGHIGIGAFEELFAHPATAGVPFVLETPGSRDAGDTSTELLRKLRDA